MDDEPSELETTVVRLFVGHAETPVWFSGPRDWDEMCLGDDLTADLRAWDAAWYASRDPDDFRWTAVEPEVEHRRRGVELAGRLADALGPPFVVQVDAVDDPDAIDDPGADDGAYRPPSRTAVASDRPPGHSAGGSGAVPRVVAGGPGRARQDPRGRRRRRGPLGRVRAAVGADVRSGDGRVGLLTTDLARTEDRRVASRTSKAFSSSSPAGVARIPAREAQATTSARRARSAAAGRALLFICPGVTVLGARPDEQPDP